MVKACCDWRVENSPCINHSLHLVVGPFLLQKKDKLTASSTAGTNAADGNTFLCPDTANDDAALDVDTAVDDSDVEDLYSDEFTDL
eukprot:15088831-Ditylum_brightwellii.AAC.1